MAKILQIIPSLDKINGGVERGTLDVARRLVNDGFESSILSSGGEMAEKYKYIGVENYSLNLKKKGFFKFFMLKNKIKNLLTQINPDIVHIRSRWPAFCFNEIIKNQKIPLVTTFHGTYAGNNFFPKKKYNSLMTKGDKVISISKFIDDHVRYYFPECKSRLVQINRGVDTSYFNIESVSEKRKENILSRFAISEKSHIFLLPARITSWKGHMTVVEASKIILKTEPSLNFVFLFVGSEDGKHKFSNLLKKKISKLNLQDKFIFCGNLNDMPAVYSIADIIISASHEPEAFGRISAEASSMTKPIISSNHGGSREIIENEITGWLVEPSNPEKLAEKIIKVLKLPQEKKDLIGSSARRRVEEKFGLDEMLKKTMLVYEDLLSTKKNFNN